MNVKELKRHSNVRVYIEGNIYLPSSKSIDNKKS
jgi:hypothetical protein